MLALTDTRARDRRLGPGPRIDALLVMEFFSDISPRFASPFGRSSIRRRVSPIGSTHIRGNSSTRIPAATCPSTSSTALPRRSPRRDRAGPRLRRRTPAQHPECPTARAGDRLERGSRRRARAHGDQHFGFCDEEARHGLRAAIHFYPLLENAIRAGLKRDVPSHMAAMGRLFDGWRGGERQSAGDPPRGLQRRAAGDDLGRQSLDLLPLPAPDECQRDHRPGGGGADHFGREGARVGHPAGPLGVPAWLRRRHRHLGVSERRRARRFTRYQRLRPPGLDMAGKTLADVAAFDLYSCFPSAVEVAMKEIGLSEDDPRPISVTGGLPFFGGPGNNYVTHSIAEMMNVVRRKPGSFGMVTANGMYLTKHSAGLYSTAPTEGPWRREDPKKLQAALDAGAKRRVNRRRPGPARSRPTAWPTARRLPKRLYPRPAGRLGRPVRRHGPQRPSPPRRHADARAAWA